VIVTNGWIIDVLSDLRAFAQMNGMVLLAAQIEEAERVAQVELASVAEKASIGFVADSLGSQFLSGAGRAGQRA
jgi:hypothetical protein